MQHKMPLHIPRKRKQIRVSLRDCRYQAAVDLRAALFALEHLLIDFSIIGIDCCEFRDPFPGEFPADLIQIIFRIAVASHALTEPFQGIDPHKLMHLAKDLKDLTGFKVDLCIDLADQKLGSAFRGKTDLAKTVVAEDTVLIDIAVQDIFQTANGDISKVSELPGTEEGSDGFHDPAGDLIPVIVNDTADIQDLDEPFAYCPGLRHDLLSSVLISSGGVVFRDALVLLDQLICPFDQLGCIHGIDLIFCTHGHNYSLKMIQCHGLLQIPVRLY